jgi:hypothetical protein
LGAPSQGLHTKSVLQAADVVRVAAAAPRTALFPVRPVLPPHPAGFSLSSFDLDLHLSSLHPSIDLVGEPAFLFTPPAIYPFLMSLYVVHSASLIFSQLAYYTRLTASHYSFSILWIYSGASTYTAPTIFVLDLLRLPT